MTRHSILLLSALSVAGIFDVVSGLHVPSTCRWNPEARLRASTDPTCPPLADDESAASGSFEPWTYPPHCVYPTDETATTGKYCVYTYTTFNGDAGMSLVALPETASYVAGILATRSEPWGHPPSFQLSPSDSQRAYEVVDIPGKQKGAVASRRIRKGEVVMRETPSVLGWTSGPEGIAREENPSLLREAFERLPAWHTERLRDMARSTGGEDHEDLLRTNAFSILVDGVDLSAIFPEIARINHACKPNVFTRYSRSTLQMDVVAHRDIEEGEELSVSYIPQNLLTDSRQKLLSRRGFTCTCPVCASAAAAAASDANKNRIQAILTTLRDLGHGRTAARIAELADELLAILDEEALGAQAGEFAALFADLYWLAGAKDKAREMAAWALERRVFYNGADSERVEKARAFVEKFAE